MTLQLTDPAEIGKAILADPYKHATQDPLFCVQELVRQFGYDPDYGCETMFVCQDEEDCREADAEETERFAKLLDECEDLPDGWRRVGYRDKWETVQVFFTEQSALGYIEENKHRHVGALRVYVESLYRNKEMQAVRQLLIDAAKAND